MGSRVAGVKFDGTPEFSLRTRPVPVECKTGPAKGGVSLRELLVNFKRLYRGGFRFWHDLRLREHAIQPKHIVGTSQAGVWQGIAGVLFNSLLEVFDTFVQTLLCPLVPLEKALEIELVGLWVDLARTCESRLLLGCESHSDLICNRARHLVLQRQNVTQLALVTVRPEVPVIFRLDELRSNPHTIARAKHRALDHPVHVQLTPNLRQGLPCSFVVHY